MTKFTPKELGIICPSCGYDYSMNDGILVEIPSSKNNNIIFGTIDPI